MTDSAPMQAVRKRRTVLGILAGGTAGILALPALIGRTLGKAVRPKAGSTTSVRTHPSAVPRTSTKAHSHG